MRGKVSKLRAKSGAFWLSVLVLAAVAIAVAIAAAVLVFGNKAQAPEANVHKVSQEQFTATATYQGGNRWHYQVEGYVPTGCHGYNPEVLVAESYPEQVTLRVTILPPANDVVCAQQIQPVEFDGSYSAGPEASFQLVVVPLNETIKNPERPVSSR